MIVPKLKREVSMDYLPFKRDYVALHGILTSLGFASERVEKAVSLLMAEPEAERNYERKRLLSSQEVQQTLSVSKSTLRRLMNSGQLHAVEIGTRRIGFRQQDVDTFINSLNRHR